MRAENFIYFLTLCGFFIGLSFAVLNHSDPVDILWFAFIVSSVFYILALGSTSMFMKHLDLKSEYNLNKEYKEYFLEKFITRIEKRERYIEDTHNFIEQLEKEYFRDKDSKERDK